jgi:putative colanic acid biosynthesis UDP-glucose lipid carrier transferase
MDKGEVDMIIFCKLKRKRLFDLAVSFLFLLFTAPLFPLIALAIVLDSRGSVFFRQLRHGQDGKTFTIYKFRTMYADQCHPTGGAQARRNDPRITRVGRLLRRFSMDEMPQVWNILRGEMSWVGPRPHPVDLDRRYADEIPHYQRRFAIKPGLTGWAQVRGHRGETALTEQMVRRVRYDLGYIRKQSVLTDLAILVRTFRILAHPMAY